MAGSDPASPDIDEFWMHRALAQASAAAAIGEVPVGAVIVAGDQELAAAGNRCEARQDATAHAEIEAIRAASARLGSWRLEGCTLYVTLEPCPMCLGACLNSRIQRVVFAAHEPKAGACGSTCDLSRLPAYNHHLQLRGGVLAAEARALLQGFFRQLRQQRRGAADPS